MDDSKGNAKRKVLVVEDNEPNKKSCPHAMKGDGRSAATPIGRLLNASSEPGSPTLDAKLHLSNGVDASAHGPITPANRDPSPRVPGLHPVPGDDEGYEAEGLIDVEPHPHPVDADTMIEAMNGLNVLMPRVLVAVPLEPIWVDDPVEPWEGMIPAQQGALLRAANYPDGFSDPYMPLSSTPRRNVRQGPVLGAFAGLQPGPEVEGHDVDNHLGRRGCPDDQEMTVFGLSINENGVMQAPPRVDLVWAAIPIDHPWKHLTSTDDGILRRNANYPTGFGNPYVVLTLTHECHKRLDWLLSVSEDALIAADRLNALIWPKHEVAPKYVNDREHQAAREFFRIMPNELIQGMRNEAMEIVDHEQTLMWRQGPFAAEGLTQFEASTMLRRSAASRATTQSRRRENISMDLVNPYDVDELSGMDTDSNEYLEPQAYALDNLDRYNRLYIDRVRVVKESQGRRANARVPQVSNVAVTTITRLKTVRTPGGSQETHFSMAYQTPDELGWLARENEANELNGKGYDARDVEPRAEHGIHRGSQLPGWETDPGARDTMVEFPDPDVRPLCHDGCTREPSEQPKAVQPELGRSQLCRVPSLPEIDGVIPTPTRDRILRDYSFVRKEVRQQNEVKTQINGEYFWPSGYPVGGASPTAQDQTGINKLMNDVKQRGCQSIINETGISELFNEARPLSGLTRVYFWHATLHFDLRFLTALERLTSNAHQCFTSYMST